jgi:hypothetical protein
MELKTLRILLQSHRETLNIGPTRLGLQRKGRALTIQLLPGPQPQDAAFGLSLTWPFDGRPIALKVQGGPVSLSALGVKEGDFGLRDVARARLSLTGTATLPQDAEALQFSASGRLVDLSIQQPRLAPRLLTGISLGWSGEGRVVLDDGRVELDGAEIQLGDVRWRTRGSVERGDDHFAVDVEGEIPLTTCDRMLYAIPDGVAPLLSGMRLAGNFSLKTAIQFDTRRPSEASVRWEMDNRCRITEVGADISPERFKRPFAYDVKGADGSPERIMTGPGTATWVPLVNISRYMETALLVCEDGRFWRHRGFDREAIANSIRDNLRAERFVRGASTISMQLAKNLFLKREKTVSRKLQEVVLTLLLEQELTKDEIMELYLNVIEYGPGVYGIGDAAEHYFRTDPSELGLSQAFFLASILPNPRASHFRADGQLSEGWSRYLHRLISIAHKRGRISDEELQSALSEHLVLGRSTPSGSSDGDSAHRPAIDPLEQRP